MKLENEQVAYRFTLLINSVIMLALSAILFRLFSLGVLPTQRYTSITVLIVSVVTAIISLLAIKAKVLLPAVCSLTVLSISLLGIYQQLNISILYLVPVYISFYNHNSKKSIKTLSFSVALFIMSKLGRASCIYASTVGTGYDTNGVFISFAITSTFEGIAFITVAVPVFILLMKQNEKLKESLLKINETIKHQQTSSDDILKFCSTSMSYHNKYLQVHIRGVKRITEVLLVGLNNIGYDLSKEYMDDIIFSVQFHDLGKIYIDSSILDKNGRLTKEEFDLVMQHPARGATLFDMLPKGITSSERRSVCRNIIIQHHERLNGSGYPLGATADEISLEAKIIAVADVADALLSWRPYKVPMTWDRMIGIFQKEAEGFDKDCLRVLFEHKKEILEISNKMNKELKKVLGLNDDEIQRY